MGRAPPAREGATGRSPDGGFAREREAAILGRASPVAYS
jgi:hypothetical protein